MNYKIPFIALFCLTPCIAFAQLGEPSQDRTDYDQQLNSTDFEAVREFLKERRAIEKAKKYPDLKITGDVRFEWRHMKEEENGRELRNQSFIDDEAVVYEHEFLVSNFPISANDFDIEFNLRFDYVAEDERTWAVAHVQYDNAAGVNDNDLACNEDPRGFHGSGFCKNVCLKKAFVGYNVCHNDFSRFDIELGRSNIYNAFTSRIEFDSRFDGILLYYETQLPYMDKWYWQFGAFVVDERVNHFAWVTEIGFLDIYNSNVDFLYSFIDWNKHGVNTCRIRNPDGFKFRISQFTFAYRFNVTLCTTKKGKLYGAFLINHQGAHARYSNFVRTTTVDGTTTITPVFKTAHNQNKGWYLGCIIGEIEGEGDWVLDVCYQVVQAFAIPDGDVSGIGRGNTLDESITGFKARGNTNFRGWRFEGLYAITDNFTLDTIIEFSTAYNKKIGHGHKYSKLELETIYAF